MSPHQVSAISFNFQIWSFSAHCVKLWSCEVSWSSITAAMSLWAALRCPGQQGEEEGHPGSEAQQPSLRPWPRPVHPGAEQQRESASGTDGPHLAEQGAVGSYSHTDRHCTHTVKNSRPSSFSSVPLWLYLKCTSWRNRDSFLDHCPTYCLTDGVMKRCKNSRTISFSTSDDLARDPLQRSSSKETSFSVSITFHSFLKH